MTDPAPETTRQELERDLRLAGIDAGDNVILHSSLRSLGAMRGGPDAVVDAFMDVIGDAGNLMVPTFTYCLPAWKSEPFDIRSTRSRTGAITEAVRNHPMALRSFHPTHSVAVLGPDAEAIVRNHMHATAIGLESPFGRMHERGAKIVMLGTRQDTNSSLHYCEVHAAVPYVEVAFTEGRSFDVAWFINERGQVEYTEIHEVPGCSRGFNKVEAELELSGVLRKVKLGPAASQVLDLPALVAAMDVILRRDPAILLCTLEGCSICPKRHRHLAGGGAAQ